jgi:hypothetical protein
LRGVPATATARPTEAIAFNDMVTNGGQGKPCGGSYGLFIITIALYVRMLATAQTREKSVVVAFVGTGISTK